MTTTVQSLVEQAAPHNHPNLETATHDQYGDLVFTFKPFTGSEPEPEPGAGIYSDRRLPIKVRQFLSAQYTAARTQWLDVAYVARLKEAAAGAPAVWKAYTAARQDMDTAFQVLGTTDSSRWIAAVSTLIATQERALEAATDWDGCARQIAEVDREFLYSDLAPYMAYKKAGLDAKEWVIECSDDYRSYSFDTPLLRRVKEAVAAQREHVQKVASLTGIQALTS